MEATGGCVVTVAALSEWRNQGIKCGLRAPEEENSDSEAATSMLRVSGKTGRRAFILGKHGVCLRSARAGGRQLLDVA